MGGYSPDTDDPYPSVTDVFDLAAELAQELGEAEEFLSEGMGICADEGDAQTLLEEFKRLRVVEGHATYLGNIERQRKMAFWADKEQLLMGRALDYIIDAFPVVISHNSHLEAWRCQAGQECEHWREEQ
jgi:hypothetical protein